MNALTLNALTALCRIYMPEYEIIARKGGEFDGLTDRHEEAEDAPQEGS